MKFCFLRFNIKELARKACVDGKEKTRRGRKAEGNANVKIFKEDFQTLYTVFLFVFLSLLKLLFRYLAESGHLV